MLFFCFRLRSVRPSVHPKIFRPEIFCPSVHEKIFRPSVRPKFSVRLSARKCSVRHFWSSKSILRLYYLKSPQRHHNYPHLSPVPQLLFPSVFAALFQRVALCQPSHAGGAGCLRTFAALPQRFLVRGPRNARGDGRPPVVAVPL